MTTRGSFLRHRSTLAIGLTAAATATLAGPATADWTFAPDLPVPNQGTFDAISGAQTLSSLHEGFGEPFIPLDVSLEGLSATAHATTSAVAFTNMADAALWDVSSVTVSANINPIGDQDVQVEWDFGADSAWGGGQIGIFHADVNEIIFLADVLDGQIAGSQTVRLIGGDQYQLFAGSGNGTGDAWGTFTVVPGPGSLALLGLVGMTGVGRRRRG